MDKGPRGTRRSKTSTKPPRASKRPKTSAPPPKRRSKTTKTKATKSKRPAPSLHPTIEVDPAWLYEVEAESTAAHTPRAPTDAPRRAAPPPIPQIPRAPRTPKTTPSARRSHRPHAEPIPVEDDWLEPASSTAPSRRAVPPPIPRKDPASPKRSKRPPKI